MHTFSIGSPIQYFYIKMAQKNGFFRGFLNSVSMVTSCKQSTNFQVLYQMSIFLMVKRIKIKKKTSVVDKIHVKVYYYDVFKILIFFSCMTKFRGEAPP